MKKLADEIEANPNNKAALHELEKYTTDSDYWNRSYAYGYLGKFRGPSLTSSGQTYNRMKASAPKTCFYESIFNVNNFFNFSIYRPENFLTTRSEHIIA